MGTQESEPDEIFPKGYFYEIHIPDEKNSGSGKLKVSSVYDEDHYKSLLSDEVETLTKEQLREIRELQKDREDAPQPVYDDAPLTQDEIEQLRQDLMQGVEKKDRDTLIHKTKLAETKNVTSEVQEEYNMALKMLATLRLRYRILQMETRTMTEIRNYRTPPDVVHEVMVAALLLLGHHEEKTREWLNCKALLESITLRKRIDQFDVGKVHPEIAARSSQLINKHFLAEVCLASAGAGTFYNWVREIVSTMEDVKNGSIKPADDQRQKEIFNIRPPSPPKWNMYL